MTHQFNSAKTAVIAPEIKWLPVTDETPIGARMLLIEKKQGVAYVRTRQRGDGFDYWHPLPTFEDCE